MGILWEISNIRCPVLTRRGSNGCKMVKMILRGQAKVMTCCSNEHGKGSTARIWTDMKNENCGKSFEYFKNVIKMDKLMGQNRF